MLIVGLDKSIVLLNYVIQLERGELSWFYFPSMLWGRKDNAVRKPGYTHPKD